MITVNGQCKYYRLLTELINSNTGTALKYERKILFLGYINKKQANETYQNNKRETSWNHSIFSRGKSYDTTVPILQ